MAVIVSSPLRAVLLLPGVLMACGLAAWVVLDSAWLKHSSAPASAVAVIALAVALAVGCARALRAGLRMDGRGVAVRNFWRTYKISWAEVRRLGDGSVEMGDAGRVWALGVVLCDGRRRNVSTVLFLSEAELDAIRQAAARYGVPAELTGPRGARTRGEQPDGEGLFEDPGGQAGLRYWDGSAWSPLLPLSAGQGRPVWKSNPAWAALPTAPEPWLPPGIEAARAKAARARIWVRLCAVVTGTVLGAGLVAGLWSGNWFVAYWVALMAMLPGMFLFVAWLNWRQWPRTEKELRNLAAAQSGLR